MSRDPKLVRDLFLKAIESPPADREALLNDRCAGDAELRAAVDRLLAAHESPARFLESAPGAEPALGGTRVDPYATRLSDAPSGLAGGESRPEVTIATNEDTAQSNRPAGFTPGQVIGGRYTLHDILGEGGMGTVFKAEQSRPVKRQVALKLIKVGMDSRTVLARFDAERQALAMMDHPNIARVYDGGATEARQPFFVMEFVQGVAITDYCDQHRLSVDARLRLFVAVCQAVQHAHQKGIIHRDLKPSNIMVTEVDGRPTPKVIDFGVAKATEANLTDQSVGDTGAIVGTPTYMSPEQADPSSMDIDTRTDVYALGVILYELLAGTPPLDVPLLRRGAVLEMLRMVREVDPPRPSTKVSTADALPNIASNRGVDPAQLKRELRGDLDWIVMKALEKDRTRRYETANGFGADVLRHLASEPVLAAPPSRSYRARKFVRKHRVGVLAAGLVLLALVAGMAGTTLGLLEARRQESRANDRAEGERLAKQKALAAAEEERKAKETVEAVLGFVETKVFAAARPKGQEGGLGYDVTLADAIRAALPAIEAGFPGKPLIEARLRSTIGHSFVYLGKPDLAAGQYDAALTLYRRELGPDHPDMLRSMNSLAHSYDVLGRHAEALKLHEEALTLCTAKLGPDHPDTLRSMNGMANSYDALGRHAEALKLRKETLALHQALAGPDYPDTLRSMNGLANCYHALGRHAEALKLREETLALRKDKLGPDHPDTLVSMSNLADSYVALGRLAEALKLREETLARHQDKFGSDHPSTRRSIINLANCYVANHRTREALPLMLGCSIADPGNAELSTVVAVLQAWFGQDEDYIATRRRFLANARGTEDLSTAEHAARVSSLIPIADKAELAASMIVALRAMNLGKGEDSQGFDPMVLGMVEYREGHFEVADGLLAAAMDRGKSNPQSDGKSNDSITGTSSFYRAMCLFRQGKNDEAHTLASAAVAKMRPLPADEQNPLADGANHDDLILWLAYKEAMALIGLDAPPAATLNPEKE